MITSMGTPRYLPATAFVGSKIYVFGGSRDSYCLDSAEAYDLSTGTWSYITPMGTRRCDLAAVATP